MGRIADRLAAAGMALALVLGALPAAAQALLSEDEIAGIARGLSEGAAFDAVAEALALPEDLRPAFAAHYREVFAAEPVVNAFLTRFATEQVAFADATRGELEDIARQMAAGWALETAELGAARLPVAEQRAVLALSRDALDGMTDEVCAASTRGALDPVEIARAEVAALARRGAGAAEAHLARLRRALAAEIADDPPLIPLSPEDEARAAMAYQEAVLAGIAAHPNRANVEVAVSAFDTATDAAVCDLTKISLDAALGLQGEAGDLVIRLLTSG